MRIRIVFAILLISLLLLSGCQCDKQLINVKATEQNIKEGLEGAYFEGQCDALEGDIRIKKIDDGCYVWLKSPWDDGHSVDFNPCGTVLDDNDIMKRGL